MAIDKITTASITDANITTAKLAYQAIPFRNLIINGDMSLAQRGTSTTGVTTSDGYYACDRWYSQTDTGTWTISQSTDVPTGQGFFNSFKMDCTSAGSSNADEVMIRSKHEGQNLQYLKYGTTNASSLTLSFWIKSNKTGNYYVAFVNNNSTQDRVVSFGYTIDSADTWEKKTITIPGDTSQSFDNTNGENLTLYWLFSAASGFTSGGVSNTWTNYAANRFANSNLAGLGGSTSDYVNITGVQLEAGTTASEFEFLPVDVNLLRCQRYCYVITGATDQAIAIGDNANGSGAALFFLPLLTTMRSAPSGSFTTASHFEKLKYETGWQDLSSIALSGTQPFLYVIEGGSSQNDTRGVGTVLRINDSSGKITLSSEL